MLGARNREILRADEFYERLRRLVRKYRSFDFSLVAARVIHGVIHEPRQWARYPLHFVLHAIEANCTYHDRYVRTLELTQRRFNEIIEFYKSYRDPYVQHVLEVEQNPESWLFAMARQQFTYQRFHDHSYAINRAILLFVKDEPMPRTEALFQEAYGLTMREWIYMCFAVFTTTTHHRSHLTTPTDYFESEVTTVPRSAVLPFLRMASLSPTQIAEAFRAEREALPNYLHIFLPSIFLEHPLIAFEDERYISPHPGLLYHFSQDGLYRACQRLDNNIFAREFGRSFESYIGKVLSELGSECQILTESITRDNSERRVCDYVAIYKDSLLLIECKGMRYSAKLMTENAIRNDNSTSKLADSFEQIVVTASRIRQGEFAHLFDTTDKKLIGITVTFGELIFANSPRYIREFILPRAKLPNVEQLPTPLDYDFQVMSIEEFEGFIAVLKSILLSPADLLNDKLAKSLDSIGDWDRYLKTEFQSQAINWHLDLTAGLLEDLFGLE